jgi:hypothetical protein
MANESNTPKREKREGQRRFEELRAQQLRKRKRRERVELPNNQHAERDRQRDGVADQWQR